MPFACIVPLRRMRGKKAVKPGAGDVAGNEGTLVVVGSTGGGGKMGDSLAGEVLVARRGVDVDAGRVSTARGGTGVGAGRVSVGRAGIAVKVAVGRGSGVGLMYPLVGVGKGEGNGESA